MADHEITDLATLEAIYDEPGEASLRKELDRLIPEYRALIEASPFLALATSGPGGLDCTPRGDPAGFVRIADDRTLLVPDRRGNNRIDSLRNIVADPRVALLFLIPGANETLRVNGRARISVAPDLLAGFAMGGATPKSVIVVEVERVYFQCGKAVVRSRLWDPGSRIDRATLPSAGAILAACTAGRLGGPDYDRAYPERQRTTLY